MEIQIGEWRFYMSHVRFVMYEQLHLLKAKHRMSRYVIKVPAVPVTKKSWRGERREKQLFLSHYEAAEKTSSRFVRRRTHTHLPFFSSYRTTRSVIFLNCIIHIIFPLLFGFCLCYLIYLHRLWYCTSFRACRYRSYQQDLDLIDNSRIA
jgi:hypothetical protein